MPCLGNSEDHCCYLKGVACKHLEENTVEDRRWVCGLRRKLGNWDDVIASTEYQTDVAPILEPLGINCRDYPDVGQWCATCGDRVSER